MNEEIKQAMRDALEKELIADAMQGDTTVLAELLSRVPDRLIYASLSDEGQKAFEPVPSDVTTIEIQSEEAVEVIANNLSIMIKHNDIGVSVDYYNREDDGLFREDQVWWEDAEDDE